jgi:zinc transport system permease protein
MPMIMLMVIPGTTTKAIIMDDFLIRALVAGLGVAVVAGPLGCFVVWRRMAYFGATLAHSALFGVALGLLLEISPTLAIVVVCIAVALVLVSMQGQRQLAGDTLLGILAHAMLALGLVATALIETVRVDLMAYLFGDILAVNDTDLIWIFAGGIIALAALAYIWRPLLAMTVHEELAAVEGVPVKRTRLLFMVIIAVVIAVAMKVVGILLIVSLLIIPAAAARPFARTPEIMAVLAVGAGCLSVVAGLGSSMTWDIPAGPAIVLVAAVLFLAGTILRSATGRHE